LNAPIQFGARLSGKLNKEWRMGFMNMQTERVASTLTPSQNYTVMALQRKVFARSNVGLLIVNRDQILQQNEKNPVYQLNPYNRNIGLEYNLASSNNLWTGKAVLLRSFAKSNTKEDWVHAANLQYSSRKWTISWQQEYVGKQYTAEVGYVPRKDYFKTSPSITRIFFSRNKKITSHAIKLFSYNYFSSQLKSTDNTSTFGFQILFRYQVYPPAITVIAPTIAAVLIIVSLVLLNFIFMFSVIIFIF
jgi:hypothetical protein